MYPRSGGTGENTPFAEQSKEKEWDKGHDTLQLITQKVQNPFITLGSFKIKKDLFKMTVQTFC